MANGPYVHTLIPSGITRMIVCRIVTLGGGLPKNYPVDSFGKCFVFPFLCTVTGNEISSPATSNVFSFSIKNSI